MLATTKAFQKGKELQTAFLNKALSDTGIEWRFVSEVNVERKIKDPVFDTKARTKGGPLSTGLDIYILDGLSKIRVRCFVFSSSDGSYASPSYNLPSDMSSPKDPESLIKQKVLKFFNEMNLYFLIVRKKGLSTIFWLDKYTNYPMEAFTLQSRFKGRRDRIVLNYSMFNIKKFDYVDNLCIKLKLAIHENCNHKTS